MVKHNLAENSAHKKGYAKIKCLNMESKRLWFILGFLKYFKNLKNFKNLKLFSIRVKELFEPLVLKKTVFCSF